MVVVPKGQQRSIVAFVSLNEPSEDESQQRTSIKQYLHGVLPYYAVPDQIIFLATLPRNKHG
ncbi:hypothetical protein SB757_35000, partial [Pseudomonas sp. SIMBA_065]